MAIKITDSAPAPEFPKPKTVSIGDVAQGEIRPTISDDRLRWHANIRPTKETSAVLCHLLHGHGPTPDAAVADAILRQRQEIAARTAVLIEIERECDTAKMSDEQLLKLKGEL